MEKLQLFVKVHQYKEQGFKMAASAKKLMISRNTVYKYLNMTIDEASEYIHSCKSSRSKKLNVYHDKILGLRKIQICLLHKWRIVKGAVSRITDWVKYG